MSYVDEVPVGCVMAMTGSATVLHGLMVVPGHRRRGHGSNLIATAIQDLEAEDVTDVFWAAVDPVLSSAYDRFRHQGFEEITAVRVEALRLLSRRSRQGAVQTEDNILSIDRRIRTMTAC